MRVRGSSGLTMTVALGLVLALIASNVGESLGLEQLTDPLLSGFTKSSGPSKLFFAKLQVGYYQGKCSIDVEGLIRQKVEQWYTNKSILAWLLRMQFHDCFVNGCDASILIDEVDKSERYANPNLSVRGYDIIDDIKGALEAQCAGVVSCADIIAVATKEAIRLGGGPDYPVETGRKDGVRSNKNDVKLPSPSMDVPSCLGTFGANGFTSEDTVVLLGGHTVGKARCGFFQDRLYEGNSQFDPNMDENLRKDLKLLCPPSGANRDNVTAYLDQNPESGDKLDTSFYEQINTNRGILPIDQALARHPATSPIVNSLLRNGDFNVKFANAMIKLQRLTDGKPGNIRKVCSRFN